MWHILLPWRRKGGSPGRAERIALNSSIAMKITQLDHLVLTVKDIDASCAFYTNVLGMQEVTFGHGRKAVIFGNQKIKMIFTPVTLHDSMIP